MRLSTKGTIRRDGHGRSGPPRGVSRAVSLAEIAARQEISLTYLEQLFARLRRTGLVKSVRGPGGGYRLSPASRETMVVRHRSGGGRADPRHPLRGAGLAQGLHDRRRALHHPRPVGRTWATRSTATWPASAWRTWSMRRTRRSAPPDAPRGGGGVSIYLDYNATAPVRPQVQAVMAEALAERGQSLVRCMPPGRARPRAHRDGAGPGGGAGRAPIRLRWSSPAAAPRPMPWRSPAPSRRAASG